MRVVTFANEEGATYVRQDGAVKAMLNTRSDGRIQFKLIERCKYRQLAVYETIEKAKAAAVRRFSK